MRGLSIGELLDADQQQDLPLVVRKISDRFGYVLKVQPRLGVSFAVSGSQIVTFVNVFLRPGGLLSADMVDPQVAQDAEHPRIEARARRKAVRVGERAFAGRLDEVVGKIAGAAEGDGEAPEIGKKGDEKVLNALVLLGRGQCRRARME